MTATKKIAAQAITALILPTIAACSGEQTRHNKASLEAEPLTPGIASPEKAISLAQITAADGVIDTLLVTGIARNTIRAVPLKEFGAPRGVDVFTAFHAVGRQRIQETAAQIESQTVAHHTYAIAALLPAGGSATRHVATGTNFPEHAEETNSDSVFTFPKFGSATPARTEVAFKKGVLLDYEVEICVRFDRDIKSLRDFDEAVKGFFLCADFTDRASLLRLIDPEDFDSGTGFSDSKSRADFFPTGPFVVIPADWQDFVSRERVTTRVNDDIRQDARGGEMILNFRQIVEKVLGDTTSDRFLYRGNQYRLVEAGYIPKGTSIMSGTAEGVIFMPPTGGDIASGVIEHIFTGAFLGQRSGYETVIERFIRKELERKRFLQPGDTVAYSASSMGTVNIQVVRADDT